MAERHRIRLTVDGDYGSTHAELICPADGCDHPVDDGEVDTSVRCWLETWAEDDLMDYFAGEQVLGEWEIDVDVVGEGEPRISLRQRPRLSLAQVEWLEALMELARQNGQTRSRMFVEVEKALAALRSELTREDETANRLARRAETEETG